MSKEILIPFKLITDNFQERLRAQSLFFKEPETVTWIQFLFDGKDVFFDVGASIGIYSLLAARCYPEMEIHSFEPVGFNCERITKNIELNGFKNIHTHQIALTDTDGTADLYLTGDVPGQACARLYQPIEEHERQPVIETIPVYRLDSYIENNNLPVPNHVKIDVDGTEFEVVKGMENILTHFRLKSILVECGDETGKNIKEYLQPFGFTHKTPFTKYATRVKSFLLKLGENNYMVVRKAPNLIFLRKDKISPDLLNQEF